MVYTKHIRLYKNIHKSDCKLINMYAFCVYCVIVKVKSQKFIDTAQCEHEYTNT